MDSLLSGDYATTSPTHLEPAPFGAAPFDAAPFDAGNLDRAAHRANLLVVIEDQPSLSATLKPICEYLGLILRTVSSGADLTDVLDDYRPLALISAFDGEYQDGGHILKTIATQDPSLPVMLLTQQNPIYQGAIDALVELLNLPNIRIPIQDPTMGDLVDFLANAARHIRTRRTRAAMFGDGGWEGDGK